MKKAKGNHEKVAKIRERIKAGYSPKIGFMHIPKTGGSGVNTFGEELVARGHRFPSVFGHGWKAEEIFTTFPDMRICLVLRDPLSKMISGFNSRLRQGRPTYNSPWQPPEAAAFALLPSVKRFLDALISDEEFDKSAVAYAMKNIRHLRWNYGFYFKNPETVRENRAKFRLIGDISDFGTFARNLAELSGAPAALADEIYQKSHESGTSVSRILESYTPEEVERMKRCLRKEYRIHSELLSIAYGSES